MITDIHNGKYTFFYGGPFSQWFHSYFKVRENKIGNYKSGPFLFNTAEQYMMYQKAALFEDYNAAALILKSTSPKEQKALGRGVIDFDKDVWEQHAREIVWNGNFEKFNQNPALYKDLMNTGDSILVEASPYDTIWGIGLNEETARITPVEDWKGTNWLGEVLTDLKQHFRTKN